MFVTQYTATTVSRQAPAAPQWSIYNVLDADTLSALRAAGVRIVGSHVMSRICPQCGEPGEIAVMEHNLQDGIAFISRDSWTCIECRRAETAHLVASPRPMPASRGGSASGSHPATKKPRPSTQQRNARQRQRAVNEAWQNYYAALDALADIAAGTLPAHYLDAAIKMRNDARHALKRHGIVPAQEVAL